MAKITVDSDKLEALIDAKVREKLAGLGLDESRVSGATTPDEWQAGVDELKGRNVAGTPERHVPCVSPTGATFVARVVKSRDKRFPEGRIVALDDYTMPAGAEIRERDGGLVPDGLDMRHPKDGTLQLPYKQWRYETFWLADLRQFVGKALTRHMAADGGAELPAWELPTRASDESADAAE